MHEETRGKRRLGNGCDREAYILLWVFPNDDFSVCSFKGTTEVLGALRLVALLFTNLEGLCGCGNTRES